MRRAFAALVLAFLLAAFTHGNTSGWHQLTLGAGGFHLELSFSCDGATKTVRNDSGDAYVWNNQLSKWMLMNTSSNVPGTPGFGQDIGKTYGMGASCKDDTKIWMVVGPYLLKSTDAGQHFANTNFQGIDSRTVNVNGSPNKFTRPHFASHPTNPDIAYFCSPAQGLFRTVNGGLDWTLITAVPAAMPIVGGTSFTTSATTSPGSRVLTLTSVTSLKIGSYVYNTTSTHETTIQPGAAIVAIDAGASQITLNADILDGGVGGVGSGDTLRVSIASTQSATMASGGSGVTLPLTSALNGPLIGEYIYDQTDPTRIPANTFITSIPFGGPANKTISTNHDMSAVQTGDAIIIVTDQASGNTVAWAGCTVSFNPATPSEISVFPANRGLWQSSDDGATWAMNVASGAPTTATYAKKMTYGPDGTFWLATRPEDYTGTSSNFWRLQSGAWTRFAKSVISTGGSDIGSFDVDPANANHVVVMSYFSESLNALDPSPTFTVQAFGPTLAPAGAGDNVATNVPWLQNYAGFISTADNHFDPGASNKLYLASGVGVFWTNPPGCHCAYNWNEQSRGLEDMQDFRVSKPPGPNVMMAVGDKTGFVSAARNTSTNTYPSVQIPVNYTSIIPGYDIDWASSQPSTVCLFGNNAGASEHSGCSQDNGVTWTQFAAYPDQPIVTVSTDTASGNTVIPVNSVPDPVYVGEGVFNTVQKILTITAPSLVTENVLHFGAGNIPAEISTSWTVDTAVNVAQHTGTAVFVPFNAGIACINFSGSDCAGTSAGDVTMTFSRFASIAPYVGLQIIFSKTGIVPSTTIAGISSNSITLTAALTADIKAGSIITLFDVAGNGGGSIALTSPTNILMIGTNNRKWPFYTKDGGATWLKVHIADNSGTCTGGGPLACPGFNADFSASNSSGETGWGVAYFANTKMVTSDRVNPNTFYIFNCRSSANGGGIYRSTDSGDTWERIWDASSITPFGGCAQGVRIGTSPYNAGHVYATGGPSANTGLWRSMNALDASPTFSLIPGTNSTAGFDTFALGAIKPGTTYPALYISGFLGNVFGLYRATNADQATPTFTILKNPDGSNVNTFCGKNNTANLMDADPITYGRVYTGLGGGSFCWGDFPYLLNRDLDPASNDNSPAFMNRVG